MRCNLIPLALLLAGCACPDHIADGGDYSRCEAEELVALLGDPAPGSRSIRSAVIDEAATAGYIADPAEWDQWERRWLLVLAEIQIQAAGTERAEKARLLQLTIEQVRTMPELREISAPELLPALAELEGSDG